MKFPEAHHAVLAAVLVASLSSASGQVTNVRLPDANAGGGVAANVIPFSPVFGSNPGSWSHLTVIPAAMLSSRGVQVGDTLLDIQFAPCGSGTIHMPNVQVVAGHLVAPLPTFSLLDGFADQALVYDSTYSGALDYACVANTWSSLGVGGGSFVWNGYSDVGVYTTHAGLTITSSTGWQGSFWREAALMRHYVNAYQASMALTSALSGLKIGLTFSSPAASPASLIAYGQGAPGLAGVPTMIAPTAPVFGNTAFGLGVVQALPGATAVLLISSASADQQIGVGADARLLVDMTPAAAWNLAALPVNAAGGAFFAAPLPPYAPALEGLSVFCQWAIVGDPFAAMTLYGVPLAMSDGLIVTLGV